MLARFTIMLLKSALSLRRPFSLAGFGGVFFKRCAATGHLYICAPPEFVQRYASQLAAKRHVPEVQPDGSEWPMRQLLREGSHERLLAYEKACRKQRRARKFIVNLCQNFAFSKGIGEIVPALLTSTSLLWDMQAERPFTPEEYLVIQGIPVSAPGRDSASRFSIETLALTGELAPDQVRHLCGNGMHLAAVGSVLLFALAMAAPVPSHSAGAEDDAHGVKRGRSSA